jgi:hypothetical protein
MTNARPHELGNDGGPRVRRHAAGGRVRRTVGRANVRVARWMIGAGMAAGAVLGLWSFGGPIPPPPGFRAFDDLPRRLARLGHIAAIALPALNLLYVPWMRRARWSDPVRRVGCRVLLFGTIGLPSLLMLAVWWGPARYLLPIPVAALIAAILLLAAGLSRQAPPPTAAPGPDRP